MGGAESYLYARRNTGMKNAFVVMTTKYEFTKIKVDSSMI